MSAREMASSCFFSTTLCCLSWIATKRVFCERDAPSVDTFSRSPSFLGSKAYNLN